MELPEEATPVETVTSSPTTITSPRVTAWSMANPTNGSTSAYASPTITGTANSLASTVKVWVNDASCALGQSVGSATVTNGAFTVSSFTLNTDGLKQFYYTVENSSASASACISTGLSYTYQANPIFTLSKQAYSVKENGTLVGSAIQVHRDVTGIASVLTLTHNTVTAIGADFSVASQTVNFTATDQDITIDPTSFGITDDATAEGDEYFTITLTVTSGGVLSSSNTQAMVNIVDDEVAGDFFFAQPLYKANENSTVDLIVHRGGSTATAASVDVDLTDASAVSTTDYTVPATLTLNFSIGDTEKTITVTIPNNGASSTNRSFFAKLHNFSGNTQSRSTGVAKVRIIDTASTACTAGEITASPFADGAAVASPGINRICTATQLAQVQNHLTKRFKLMADIDLAGTGFTPITGAFTGTFDGNEFEIKNWTYDAVSAVSIGLIATPQPAANATESIKNVNLNYSKITSAGTCTGLLVGLIGTTVCGGSTGVHLPLMTNNFTSGYIDSAGAQTGLLYGRIVLAMAAAQTLTLQNQLSHGSLQSSEVQIGGVAGLISNLAASTAPTYILSDLYNDANLRSTYSGGSHAYVGGIFGLIQDALTTPTGLVILDQSQNRGYVSAVDSVTGGLVGYSNYSLGFQITNSVNYAPVVGAGSYVGGIVGYFNPLSSVNLSKLDTVKNYGAVNCSNQECGGLIGYATPNNGSPPFSVLSSLNAGTVTGINNVGGLIGSLQNVGASNNITIDGNTNSGDVIGNYTGYSAQIGGLIGYWWGTLGTTSVSNNTSSGSVTVQDGNLSGGLIGLANLTGGTLAMSSNTVSGTLSGFQRNAGLVGSLSVPGGTLTASNNSVTSAISGTTEASGMFGILGLSSNNATISNNTISATLSGTSNVGGVAASVSLSNTSTVTMSSNSIAGTITVSSARGGGVVGLATILDGTLLTLTSNINNCPITGAASSVGGIIGSATVGTVGGVLMGGLTLTSNLNKANLTKTSGATANWGGIIGAVTAQGVSKAFSTDDQNQGSVDGVTGSAVGGIAGAVTLTEVGASQFTRPINSGDINATGYSGGVVGAVQSAGTGTVLITGALNSASVTSQAVMGSGGIAGYVQGSSSWDFKISNSYSNGNIVGTGRVGGLVGWIEGAATAIGVFTLQNNYAMDVTVVAGASGDSGGLVGAYISGSTPVTFTNNYSLANISTTAGVKGGLIGNKSAAATVTVTSSFFRKDGTYNTAITQDLGGVAGMTANQTDAALQIPATFSGAGWDISPVSPGNIWLDPGMISGYPYPTLQ